MLKEAASGKLSLDLRQFSRSDTFPGESSVKESLLDESGFNYDAIIVHGDALHKDVVIDYALFGLEYHGLTFERVVYISSSGCGPEELKGKGIRCLATNRGNGHLSRNDATKLVEIIAEIIAKTKVDV